VLPRGQTNCYLERFRGLEVCILDGWRTLEHPSRRVAAVTQSRRALVVSPSPELAGQVLAWLGRAGFTTVHVQEFLAARAALDSDPPDVLVTEVKLGAYNGLHLAIRLRTRDSKTQVILIGNADPVLEAEAERAGAAYLRTPAEEPALLAAIGQLEPQYQATRRWPRKRVPALEALMDAVPVQVVDVSYEGLRFHVLEAEAAALPQAFVVSIPRHNVSCRAQRIWVSPSSGRDPTSCGATLVGTDPADAAAWRALVDSVPDCAMLAT
jgi:DNA-binding response OmpR family regulator